MKAGMVVLCAVVALGGTVVAQEPTVPLEPVSMTWEKEPTGFHGLDFGMPWKDAGDAVKKASRKTPVARDGLGTAYCDKDKSGSKGEFCFEKFLIGTAPVDALYKFEGGGLSSVYVGFSSRDYAFLKDVLVQKYGQPTSAEEVPVKTRMGVDYTNEILEWRGGKVWCSLRKYAGSIDKGSLSLTLRSALEAGAKTREQEKAKAVDAF